MDSKLLAGAYSKRYKYIEKDQLETYQNEGDIQSTDVLAKARKLSQETNKRRKLLAQKRKQEVVREEKRRQEILNRRHQEQKQATEKYQRCHVGTRPRHSPRRRGHSPAHNRVNLEEALRLVRGSSAPSGPSEQSSEALQRMYHTQHNGRDPLERSHLRSSRTWSAGGQKDARQNRPSSGRTLDASLRTELMERSMRNLASSRTRFEQQLQQHQQLLVEQQQKSLRDFNKAIRKEIDADVKVQGVEETSQEEVALQSESLSSLDSLEEGEPALNPSLPDQSMLRDTAHREAVHSDSSIGMHSATQQRNRSTEQNQSSQQRPVRPQSAKDVSYRQPDQPHYTGNQGCVVVPSSHGVVVGPIPQGYYTSPSGLPPSSTPVIHGNCYPDSLDANQPSPERRVAVGTALRLPQQSPPASQPVKQPPPALQYDSQLLAHRKFENHNTQSRGGTGTVLYSNGASQREAPPSKTDVKVPEELTSALTQHERPVERPKAHVYAWTSPPPEDTDQESNTTAVPGQTSHGTNNYCDNMVADRVMVTNVHPQTCRTISTAATTTWIHQSVTSASNREPAYSQASHSTAQSSLVPQSQHAEIPKNQGQKPGSVLTSAGTYPSTTGLKIMGSMPASYHSYTTNTDTRFQDGTTPSGPGKDAYEKRDGPGFGIVNGRLTTVETTQGDGNHQQGKITVMDDETDGKKEVRSILKRVNREGVKAPSTGQTTFNVQDSLEIAKVHFRNHEQAKRRKALKKGVRFADLHYPEDIEEDTDSTDSMIDSAAAANSNANNMGKTAAAKTTGTKAGTQKARPASARVVSSTPKTVDTKMKGPRVTSAGPSRNPPAARPKAAAHIIMSGDMGSQHHQPESGLTAHKSQLEKKVMLINNNFMSKVPMYSGSATSTTATPSSTATIYTASQTKNGQSTIPTTVTMDSSNNGYAKTSQYSQSTDQSRTRAKSSVPGPHATTVLPSHSHFSNTQSYKGVYNENGMRIDRTPTDDEINNLWKNMRTMLSVSEGKGGGQQAPNDQPRPQVQLSHQYIDGASLGFTNNAGRVSSYPANKPTTVNGPQNGYSKPANQNKNGYLQRYTLLQQRRAPNAGLGGAASRGGDVVEQTVQPMPINSNGSDPRYAAVNVSYAPREEMSESMAGFLAAEQAVQAQGAEVRDSRVMAAMESAQNQQEMYNSIRQKVAKGGPSALSMEERQLLESLDKLNDRLRVVENRQTSNQQMNYTNNAGGPQMYIHGSGFRGHQVISSPSYRRNSPGLRSSGRPASARLLTRPYR